MAVTNVFGVTSKTEWGTVEQFQNSLATAALATPYTGFDNTSAYGMSATLRYPVMYQKNNGMAFTDDQINSTVQRTRQIAITDGANGTIHNVPINLTGLDFTFEVAADNLDSFWKRYVDPMTIQGGNAVNLDLLLDMEEQFTDTIGSASVQLDGNNTMQRIDAMISAMGMKYMGQKYFAMSPFAFAALQGPYATYFNQAFNSPILRDNRQIRGGNFAGIDVYVDEQIQTHTNGTWTASGDVTIVSVTGTGDINAAYSVINVTGLTSGATIAIGDRIQINTAGLPINKVNPQTKQQFNIPMTYRVLNATTVGVGGTATLNVYPPIVGPVADPSTTVNNPYQNSSRLPVADDVVTVFGGQATVDGPTSYVLNYVFCTGSIVLANPKLYYSPIQPSSKNKQPMFAMTPYQVSYREKIDSSDLTVNFDIMSQGDIKSAANTIVLRTADAPASFNGYGFVVASPV